MAIEPKINSIQAEIAGIISIKIKAIRPSKIRVVTNIARIFLDINILLFFTIFHEDFTEAHGRISGNVVINKANIVENTRYIPTMNSSRQTASQIIFSGTLAAIPLVNIVCVRKSDNNDGINSSARSIITSINCTKG